MAKSKLENFKYYTSLMLGTLCIVCIFAFLFLVPFVLDPAISTLMHEFVDTPVTCKVSRVDVKHGKSNCRWSSCREGCTADMFQCYQVSRANSLAKRLMQFKPFFLFQNDNDVVLEQPCNTCSLRPFGRSVWCTPRFLTATTPTRHRSLRTNGWT